MQAQPIAALDAEPGVHVNIVWQGVLMLPIYGMLDSHRAQEVMDALLEKIVATRATSVIIDIVGVETVDTAVANHLIQISRATRLMGCVAILSGLSPVVARTIVNLGIELSDVETRATLADALALAFERAGFSIVCKPAQGGEHPGIR